MFVSHGGRGPTSPVEAEGDEAMPSPAPGTARTMTCGLSKSVRCSSPRLGTSKQVIQLEGSFEVTFAAVVMAVASPVQGQRRQQLRWGWQSIWC